jgi:hypothetical protein
MFVTVAIIDSMTWQENPLGGGSLGGGPVLAVPSLLYQEPHPHYGTLEAWLKGLIYRSQPITQKKSKTETRLHLSGRNFLHLDEAAMAKMKMYRQKN